MSTLGLFEEQSILPIITKEFRAHPDGLTLEEINKGFDLMHAGESIRSVVVY